MLLWGIPSFFAYDVSIGSKLSYLNLGLLLFYYLLSEKRQLAIPFLALGLFYFIISGLMFVEDTEYFNDELLKYLILIICGTEVARNTTLKELFIILLLGASSILIHALVYQDDYGRYSGLYLDPNGAGFVCILAYCLSFSIKQKKLRLLGQFLVTFAGLLTFSRTFILLWLIVSIVSVIANKKNSLNFGLGIGAIIVVFSLATIVQFNTTRFSALENLFGEKPNSSINVIKEDSRLDTWSRYSDMITENPIFGNGFKVLSGESEAKQGVHNTYLMILGESGIFPFLIVITLYLYMLWKSTFEFKSRSHRFMLAISIIIILMSTHNYFDNHLIIFLSLWLFVNLSNKELIEENQININTKTASL